MKSVPLLQCLATFAVVGFLGVGCSSDPPAVPLGSDGSIDQELTLGRDVYGARCANCHGSSGGGGSGPRLAGILVEIYPNPADQTRVIRQGRNNMPSFAGTLSAESISAVVRYTREVLS